MPISPNIKLDCIHMVEGANWALNVSRGCWLKGYEPDCRGCHIYATETTWKENSGSPFVETKACLIEVAKYLATDNVNPEYADKTAKFIRLGLEFIKGM